MDRAASMACCIVGAGPAGAVLALLLARRGVGVTLLESRVRWGEREFRGNTLNPCALDILHELGLVGELLRLRHAKVRRFVVQAAGEEISFADFSKLKSRYPYVLMLPQSRFLEFLVAEARRYPSFRLQMGARAKGLIREEGGRVVGVRYEDRNGPREVRANLTVGADGRFSVLRKLSGLEPETSSSPMDVLWFELPREEGDPEEAGAIFRATGGALLVMMDHYDSWQIGYIIKKGGYKEVKDRGLAAFRRSVGDLAPELVGRLGLIRSWKEVSQLPVESDRLRRWYLPGLLMIGDAAHTASPVGGVGINLAIQDAAVTAEELAGPLKGEGVEPADLRRVQRRREGAVRMVQTSQDLAQRFVVAKILRSEGHYRLPAAVRIVLRSPILRDVPSRLIAYCGFRKAA